MSNPLVSVIIPTYNRAATLRRTVDSALAQAYQPIEVIVVDDGSSDSTTEVLDSYGNMIRAIRQENGGPSAARNTGARAAKGEWLAFLDSDDVWLPDKIARQVRIVTSASRPVCCCMCNAAILDDRGDTGMTTFGASGVRGQLGEGYWPDPAPLIATRFILFNQVALIRRDSFVRLGGFDPELRLLEDHEFAFRLSLEGPWAFVADPLVEKYNDTGGIGVVAMADPMVHCAAWKRVIEGFLADGSANIPAVEGLLRMALAEVRAEMLLLGWRKSSWPMRLASRAGMLALHKFQGLRRRLPGWPKTGECGSLPAVESIEPALVTPLAAEGESRAV